MKKIATLLLLTISLKGWTQNSEIRDLPMFDGITLSTSGTVYVTQGAVQRVELKGREEVLEKIETEVRGTRLVIKTRNSDDWFGWSSSADFDIYVTVKDLNKLHVAGSGRIYTENKISTRDMELDVSGSGKMEVEVDAQYINASISGSGKMEIEGQAIDLETKISGSGNIYGEDMAVENCEARISGSGRIEVRVSKSIDARISGSGSVYYRGNPDRVNSSSSGSGKVRKMS